MLGTYAADSSCEHSGHDEDDARTQESVENKDLAQGVLVVRLSGIDFSCVAGQAGTPKDQDIFGMPYGGGP